MARIADEHRQALAQSAGRFERVCADTVASYRSVPAPPPAEPDADAEQFSSILTPANLDTGVRDPSPAPDDESRPWQYWTTD